MVLGVYGHVLVRAAEENTSRLVGARDGGSPPIGPDGHPIRNVGLILDIQESTNLDRQRERGG